MPTKEAIRERLRSELDRAAAVRASLAGDKPGAGMRQALRSWQSERLRRTYADLLASPRYRATATFFLSDLYGPGDLTRHEEAVRGLLPVMERILPVAGLETIAEAMELNALSESLDAAMVGVLAAAGEKAIDARSYARAYAAVGRREERERQIRLIAALGRSLDALTHHPLIGSTLSMMRTPARLAGLGELQSFLERGYAAFREMGGAEEFLSLIENRELALLGDLLDKDDAGLVALMMPRAAS